MPRLRRIVRRLLGRSDSRRSTPPPPIEPVVQAEGLESPPASLLERQSAGETLRFIDVRSPEERETMIPGALGMTTRELERSWRELAGDATVVVYCGTGGQSVNAAELLRERGLKDATCILGGLPAWEDAGGPIERQDD